MNPGRTDQGKTSKRRKINTFYSGAIWGGDGSVTGDPESRTLRQAGKNGLG